MSMQPSIALPPRSEMTCSPRTLFGPLRLLMGRPSPYTKVSKRVSAAALRAVAARLRASEVSASEGANTDCTSYHGEWTSSAGSRWIQTIVGVAMRVKPSRFMSLSAVYVVSCQGMGCPLPARVSAPLILPFVSLRAPSKRCASSGVRTMRVPAATAAS